mmetsp:Transcript_10346/g.15221  ORF Transcript_10346/g.15221 Transcript_10346/m.15221 type:complete len:691 (+) Transcript_10346:45-2117(+)
MFRPKRKSKRAIRINHEDNDDEEEHKICILPKQPKKRRKTKAVMIRSFGEDEPDSTRKPKKLGFGGGSFSYDDNNSNSNLTDKFRRYSKDEIDNLKQEQAKLQKHSNEETKQDQPPEEISDNGNQHVEKKELMKRAPKLPDQAGVSSLEHIIVIGEEAENIIQPEHTLQQGKGLVDQKTILSLSIDNDIDDGGWENQIAKRAGISTGTVPAKRRGDLETLRKQISEAIDHLSLELGDMNQLSKRRRVELQHCQKDAEKHEKDLDQAGNQLDFYQELRIDLTSWVGALRELSTKIEPIKEATKDLYHLANPKSEWTHWENDAVHVLQSDDCIRVLGRQPLSTHEEEVLEVDEFGRNLKSKTQLERESRHRKRDLYRQEKSLRGDESDALISLSQETEWRNREEALRKATLVAIDTLEEKYRCSKNLISIFLKWKERDPEDYRNCHAGMSLADLAAILLKAEISSSKSNHPLYFQQSANTLIPVIEMLKDISSNSHGLIPQEDTPLYRIMDKVFIPTFEETLSAYNPLSSRQSKSMASYYQLLLQYMPLPNIMMDKLTKQLIECCRENLDGIAIPLIPPNKNKLEFWTDDLEREAFEYATKIQKVRIEKVLNILFEYWVPVLGEFLAEPILDFTATQFLYLCVEGEKEIFLNIWEKIDRTGWLAHPHHMVAAAPLKAAASYFLINGTPKFDE